MPRPSRRRPSTCRCTAAREQPRSAASASPETPAAPARTRDARIRSRRSAGPPVTTPRARPRRAGAPRRGARRPTRGPRPRGRRWPPAPGARRRPSPRRPICRAACGRRRAWWLSSAMISAIRSAMTGSAPSKVRRCASNDTRARLSTAWNRVRIGDDPVEPHGLAALREDLLDVVERVHDQAAADRDVVGLVGRIERLHAQAPHDLGEVGAVLLLVGRVTRELPGQVRVVRGLREHPQLLGALQLGAAEAVDHLDALVEGHAGEEVGVLLGGLHDVSGVGRVHRASSGVGAGVRAARPRLGLRGGSGRARTCRPAAGRARRGRSGRGGRAGRPRCRCPGRARWRRAAAPGVSRASAWGLVSASSPGSAG